MRLATSEPRDDAATTASACSRSAALLLGAGVAAIAALARPAGLRATPCDAQAPRPRRPVRDPPPEARTAVQRRGRRATVAVRRTGSGPTGRARTQRGRRRRGAPTKTDEGPRRELAERQQDRRSRRRTPWRTGSGDRRRDAPRVAQRELVEEGDEHAQTDDADDRTAGGLSGRSRRCRRRDRDHDEDGRIESRKRTIQRPGQRDLNDDDRYGSEAGRPELPPISTAAAGQEHGRSRASRAAAQQEAERGAPAHAPLTGRSCHARRAGGNPAPRTAAALRRRPPQSNTSASAWPAARRRCRSRFEQHGELGAVPGTSRAITAASVWPAKVAVGILRSGAPPPSNAR